MMRILGTNTKAIRSFVAIIAFFLSSMLCSCAQDGDDDRGPSARCELSRDEGGTLLRYCAEYQNLSEEQLIEVKNICLLDYKGTWDAEASCSRSDSMGTCDFSQGDLGFRFFYYAGFTEQTAMESCNHASGNWHKP